MTVSDKLLSLDCGSSSKLSLSRQSRNFRDHVSSPRPTIEPATMAAATRIPATVTIRLPAMLPINPCKPNAIVAPKEPDPNVERLHRTWHFPLAATPDVVVHGQMNTTHENGRRRPNMRCSGSALLADCRRRDWASSCAKAAHCQNTQGRHGVGKHEHTDCREVGATAESTSSPKARVASGLKTSAPTLVQM